MEEIESEIPKSIDMKIKYNNTVYDNIINFSCYRSYNEKEKNDVYFTSVDSKNVEISVRCKLKDIEIIKK